MVDTAGAQRHPLATERLMEYWAHGEGAATIAWNTPGDFDRCVVNLAPYFGDGGDKTKGLCANLHHMATGTWPGDHDGDGHRDEPRR